MRIVTVFAMFFIFGIISIAENLKFEDYKLIDINKNKTNLYSYIQKGKPSIIVFYAEWCPYCNTEILYLNELLKTKKGFSVLALTLDADPAVVNKFIENNDISFPIVFASQEMIKAYQVRGIPVTLFVNNRSLVDKMVGFDKDSFEKIIDSMLKAEK